MIFRLTLPLLPCRFAPGDCNLDSTVEIADAICLLGFLFLGSSARLPCGDGTMDDPASRELFDWNGDAGTNFSDTIGLLGWLFRGGPPHVLGSDCRPTSGMPGGVPGTQMMASQGMRSISERRLGCKYCLASLLSFASQVLLRMRVM